MKKTLYSVLAACLLLPGAASARSLDVNIGNIAYSYRDSSTGDIVFDSSDSFTIGGKTFKVNEVSSLEVVDNDLADNAVAINYTNGSATMRIAAGLAPFITADVFGGTVLVSQADDVAEEIEYILSGSGEAFCLTGSFKATVTLNGVNLTSPDGAALDIQNGKRIALKLAAGSTNTLSDTAGGAQKGCIVCKGHLEISGTGALTVAGKTAHAIYAKEYIEIKKGDITVTEAVKDGVNCNQYFTMKGGTLTIAGVGDDGIQTSFKDDTDRGADDTASIFVSGGTINATTSAKGAKALKADGDFNMTGGTIKANVSGDGMWNTEKAKTKAAACIGADGNVTIGGGSLDLTANGSGGKGINCDGIFTMTDGTLLINTYGGMYVYQNGKEYTDYTGSTDRINSNYKSSPKGIKADGNVNISGGSIDATTRRNGGEGIESKAILTIDGGTIKVRAYDDAINSSSHMYINGGDIEVIATNNDGLDSNGNLYLAGGKVRAFGASSPECGLDANEESGYTVYITGGDILAVGGNNSVPSKSGSTQAYVVASTTVTASSTLSISASDGTTLASFEIPSDYTSTSTSSGPGGNRPGGGGSSGKSVLISTPGLSSGSSYTVKSGTSSTTATARLTGGSSGGGRPF